MCATMKFANKIFQLLFSGHSLDLSFFFHPQTKISIILCYVFSLLYDIIMADAWIANIF